MDLQTAYDQFSGIGDVTPPREIEVETANGVKGTIAIPHAVDVDDFLQLGYAPPTRKVALLLHGQGGHRDYCFQKKLAHKLAAEAGMYSLRIDFRGCGASADVADAKEGRTLASDVEDIKSAVSLLTSAKLNPLKFAFDVSAIVGHSRGVVAMFLWAVEQQRLLDDPKTAGSAVVVPNLVNCSSRFRSITVLDRYPVYDEEFEWIEQKSLRHGKIQGTRITRQELRALAEADTASVAELSPEWSVLSVYGTEDTIVPKEDGAFFANVLGRGAYTHHLELIDGADHNFYGVEPITNASDHEEHNRHGLPLSKNNVVNYNYVVAALVVKYLRPEQELRRFRAAHAVTGPWTGSEGSMSRDKHVPGVANFRDLGGWPVRRPTFPKAGPCYVRPGVLFRCANMAEIAPAGLEILAQLGVRSVFDLRSEEECTKHGFPSDLASAGIARVHAPVFRHEDYSPEAIALRFSKLLTSWHTYEQIYDQMLESGTDAFRQMFVHIRDRPGVPLVFHCTAGKDRTGVFGMLVLRLAGVDRLTVAKEYALTTYGLMPDHDKIKQVFLAAHAKMEGDERGQAVADMIVQGRKDWSIEVDGFNNLISSRAEAMLATMDLLDEKYGGILNYMEEYLKFSREDVETIFGNIVSTEKGTGAKNVAKF